MKIGFYSTMAGVPWGGSEELWSQAALRLLERGYRATVNYRWWPEPVRRLAQLEQAGAQLWRRGAPQPTTLRSRLKQFLGKSTPSNDAWSFNLRWLERERPDFVLITLGWHLDELSIGRECALRGIPYALNLQVASTVQWLHGRYELDLFREVYAGARRCFFLSRENQEIMETNLGSSLPHAQIVDNPFAVPFDADLPWPAGNRWRLACVGRIHFMSKAQDLILGALRRPEWRQRNVEVVFWGEDDGNLRQLESLIERYGLQDQAKIAGFTHDIQQLWTHHHALLLPSRFEGLPMVTVEAMLSGRIPIVTRCGRNAELVDDGQSGFLAPSPTLDGVAEVLERAWQRRDDWQSMGRQAASRIRQRYSHDPSGDFADHLEQLWRPAAVRRAA